MSLFQDAAQMPAPDNDKVHCSTFGGGVYAARGFKGNASEEQTAAQVQELQQLMTRDALSADGSGQLLAQYYDLLTDFRPGYNEVLQRLDVFDVWGQKRV